jgi:hypothetical protein
LLLIELLIILNPWRAACYILMDDVSFHDGKVCFIGYHLSRKDKETKVRGSKGSTKKFEVDSSEFGVKKQQAAKPYLTPQNCSATIVSYVSTNFF